MNEPNWKVCVPYMYKQNIMKPLYALLSLVVAVGGDNNRKVIIHSKK